MTDDPPTTDDARTDPPSDADRAAAGPAEPDPPDAVRTDGGAPPESTAPDRDAPAAREGTPGPVTEQTEVVYQATPTIRPVLIWFTVVLVIGGGILGYLLANPTIFGDEKLTDIVFWVVFLLVAVTLLRFAVSMFILTRTRYMVTSDDIRREYELVFRRHAREIPIEKVRGMEFNQSRIQSLLGYGTLSFLAGGTNQSLGFVEFEHLPQPHSARDTIRDTIARRVE